MPWPSRSMPKSNYSGLISEVLPTRSSSFSASLTCMRIPTDFLLTRDQKWPNQCDGDKRKRGCRKTSVSSIVSNRERLGFKTLQLTTFSLLWFCDSLFFLCPEQDSNLHASQHSHLKRARLPFRHLGIGWWFVSAKVVFFWLCSYFRRAFFTIFVVIWSILFDYQRFVENSHENGQRIRKFQAV